MKNKIKFTKEGKLEKGWLEYDVKKQNLIINIPKFLEEIRYFYVDYKGKID